ncbi:MAG: MBL fold metallo-hydrolase [Sphaerochaetaceae bacterium]
MINYGLLGSGSSGNSYLISTQNSAILIDAGFSLKQLKLRSEQLKLDFSKVEALCLTHIHPDHSKTAGVFARQTKLPVFVNENLLDEKYYDLHKLGIPQPLLKPFSAGQPFKIGEFVITSFPTSHDSPHSVGFNIKTKGRSITIVTDTGIIDKTIMDFIDDTDILFIEANYEKEMLLNGPYPYYLKQRIASKEGHLSNSDTIEALNRSSLKKTQHIYFCHLSKTNNCSILLTQRSSKELSWNGKTTVCEHGALYGGSIEGVRNFYET